MSFVPSRLEIALALPLAGLSCLASAQVRFPVEPPASQVGEFAKYRVVDQWNGRELRTVENELVEVQPDRFVLRVVSPAGSAPRTSHFNRQWQPCRTLQGSDQPVCTGSFKFPMQPGNAHSYEKLPWPNGQGHAGGKCEVVGEEKVTVPAGTFDTVKVECNGFWNRVFGGTSSGRQKEAAWYAPSISRMVKSEFTNYTSGGQMDTREMTELVEFRKR